MPYSSENSKYFPEGTILGRIRGMEKIFGEVRFLGYAENDQLKVEFKGDIHYVPRSDFIVDSTGKPLAPENEKSVMETRTAPLSPSEKQIPAAGELYGHDADKRNDAGFGRCRLLAFLPEGDRVYVQMTERPYHAFTLPRERFIIYDTHEPAPAPETPTATPTAPEKERQNGAGVKVDGDGKNTTVKTADKKDAPQTYQNYSGRYDIKVRRETDTPQTPTPPKSLKVPSDTDKRAKLLEKYFPDSNKEFDTNAFEDHLIEDVLPETGFAFLAGASGAGKSFCALDLGMTIAAGRDNWLGHTITEPNRGRPVFYIAFEGEGGIKRRLAAWSKEHPLDGIPENFHVAYNGFNLSYPNDNSDGKSGRNTLCEMLPPRPIIILDTTRLAFGGMDEVKDAFRITNDLKEMCRIRRDLLIVCIHHFNKTSSLEKDEGDRNAMSGGYALSADSDGVLLLTVNDEGKHVLTVAKIKDGCEGKRLCFVLKTVEVGKTKSGRIATSCVIYEAEPPQREAGRPTGGKWSQIVNKAIKQTRQEISDETGEQNVSTIPRNKLRAAVEKVAVEYGDESDADTVGTMLRKELARLASAGKLKCTRDTVVLL